MSFLFIWHGSGVMRENSHGRSSQSTTLQYIVIDSDSEAEWAARHVYYDELEIPVGNLCKTYCSGRFAESHAIRHLSPVP
jgi:hypothetical protein